MKKLHLYLAFFGFIFGTGVLHGQQYHENVYFDTTLASVHLYGTECIAPEPGGLVVLDSSLFNYVSGLRFIVVIDSASGGIVGGVAGDTIELNEADPSVAFLLTNNDPSIYYHVAIVGTPTVVNQSYPCQLLLDQCTCLCPFETRIIASPSSPTCLVGTGIGISAENKSKDLRIYPNPTTGLAHIDLGQTVNNATLNIYNPLGVLVHTQVLNGVQYIDHALPAAKGIYLLQVVDQDGGTSNYKVVKN